MFVVMRTALPFCILAIQGHTALSATIDITYNFVPPAAQTAIDHAASIWESILVSPVPIKAMVTWVPMAGNALGITFPNGRKDFASAPIPQTWYATALANSIAQLELNPGESDFDIFLDSGTNWYLGTDGLTPNGQYDLVSAALHEMGHGLGFIGLSNKADGIGSLGLLLQADFAPLVPSFPWPQLDTLPGIFDRFLAHPQNGPLDMMENPGTALGSALTSNQLRFNGAQATAANAGTGPRIYSPSVFALGSSCVHLNESTYPTGDPNELMTPFSATGHANHWPGPVCIGVMRDIGWVLAPELGIPASPHPVVPCDIWPNPTTDLLHIVPVGSSVVQDALGRCVMHASGGTIDVSELVPGSYHVLTTIGRTRHVRAFMKR
jgi:hypothetical protein